MGSVLAILAAIGIAMWQRHVERGDRKAADASAARSVAVVVLREVRVLGERLRNVAARLSEPFDEHQGNPVPSFQVPQALWDMAPVLHTVGRPADAVTSTLFHIQEAAALTNRGILWGEHSAMYINHITAAKAACDLAVSQLRASLANKRS